MMSIDSHVILRKMIQITVADPSQLSILKKQDIHHLVEHMLLPLIGQICDEQVPDHLLMQVEKLTIDGGTIQAKYPLNLPIKEIHKQFSQQIEHRLAQIMQCPTAQNPIPLPKAQSEAVVHYLQEGHFTWWHYDPHPTAVEKTYLTLLDGYPEQIQAIWHQLAGQKEATERFVSHFSPDTIKKTLAFLSQGSAKLWEPLICDLNQWLQNAGILSNLPAYAIQQKIFQSALNILVDQQHIPNSSLSWFSGLLEQIAQLNQISYPFVVQQLYDYSQAHHANTQTPISPLIHQLHGWMLLTSPHPRQLYRQKEVIEMVESCMQSNIAAMPSPEKVAQLNMMLAQPHVPLLLKDWLRKPQNSIKLATHLPAAIFGSMMDALSFFVPVEIKKLIQQLSLDQHPGMQSIALTIKTYVVDNFVRGDVFDLAALSGQIFQIKEDAVREGAITALLNQLPFHFPAVLLREALSPLLEDRSTCFSLATSMALSTQLSIMESFLPFSLSSWPVVYETLLSLVEASSLQLSGSSISALGLHASTSGSKTFPEFLKHIMMGLRDAFDCSLPDLAQSIKKLLSSGASSAESAASTQLLASIEEVMDPSSSLYQEADLDLLSSSSSDETDEKSLQSVADLGLLPHVPAVLLREALSPLLEDRSTCFSLATSMALSTQLSIMESFLPFSLSSWPVVYETLLSLVEASSLQLSGSSISALGLHASTSGSKTFPEFLKHIMMGLRDAFDCSLPDLAQSIKKLLSSGSSPASSTVSTQLLASIEEAMDPSSSLYQEADLDLLSSSSSDETDEKSLQSVADLGLLPHVPAVLLREALLPLLQDRSKCLSLATSTALSTQLLIMESFLPFSLSSWPVVYETLLSLVEASSFQLSGSSISALALHASMGGSKTFPEFLKHIMMGLRDAFDCSLPDLAQSIKKLLSSGASLAESTASTQLLASIEEVVSVKPSNEQEGEEQVRLSKTWIKFLETGQIGHYTHPDQLLEAMLKDVTIFPWDHIVNNALNRERFITQFTHRQLVKCMQVHSPSNQPIAPYIQEMYHLWTQIHITLYGPSRQHKGVFWDCLLQNLPQPERSLSHWLGQWLKEMAHLLSMPPVALLHTCCLLIDDRETSLSFPLLTQPIHQLHREYRAHLDQETEVQGPLKPLYMLLKNGPSILSSQSDLLPNLQVAFKQSLAESPEWLHQILDHHPNKMELARTIVYCFSKPNFMQLLVQFWPNDYSMVEAYLKLLEQLPSLTQKKLEQIHAWRQEIYLVVLHDLLMGYAMTPSDLFHRTLACYSQVLRQEIWEHMVQMDPEKAPSVALIQALSQIDPISSPVSKTAISSQEAKLVKPGQEQSKKDREPIVVYTQQSGMVFLYPFFKELFNANQLLNHQQFHSKQAMHNGVHLIQYIVTQRLNEPEWKLLLPKLLCGIPHHEVLMPYVHLMDEKMEKEEVETILQSHRVALLNQAINKWKNLDLLKKESDVSCDSMVDLLNDYFFSRVGVIAEKKYPKSEELGEWNLSMVRKAYDHLDILPPWLTSTIQLPWMKTLINLYWLG